MLLLKLLQEEECEGLGFTAARFSLPQTNMSRTSAHLHNRLLRLGHQVRQRLLCLVCLLIPSPFAAFPFSFPSTAVA